MKKLNVLNKSKSNSLWTIHFKCNEMNLINNRLLKNKKDDLYLKYYSPNIHKNKKIINLSSEKDDSIYEYSNRTQNNISNYNLLNNKYKYNSFISKLNSNKNDIIESYKNIYFLNNILNKENENKEKMKNKIKKIKISKINRFLFSEKNKKKTIHLNITNNNKKERKNSFNISVDINKNKTTNENNIEIYNDKINNIYNKAKDLLPRIKIDDKLINLKWNKIMINNNKMIKRFILKQKQKSDRILNEIKKDQSNEITNLKLGLALLKTKKKYIDLTKF